MDWFQKLTGFVENRSTRKKMLSALQNGTQLFLNGRTFECGRLEVPTLADLRSRCSISSDGVDTKIQVIEIISDVGELHEQHPNAVFQVASQFNLLEMVSPDVTPEHGITCYQYDSTQGPACSIAAGAATIYRNYLVPMDDYPTTSPSVGQIGQTEDCQIDCLADLDAALTSLTGNISRRPLWDMKNGYALCTTRGLKAIATCLQELSEEECSQLMGKLRVGIQCNAQVTTKKRLNHTVTQVFCSALPAAYTTVPVSLWEDFACLVLQGLYEATLYAALENYRATGNRHVFLTYVGGGVFGNRDDWIVHAIVTAIKKFRNTPLQLKLVSYQNASSVAAKVLEQVGL